jgi:hypothetical protein
LIQAKEIPNSRFQIPNKFKNSKNKFKTILDLELGIWCLFGIWNLEFGIWNS